MDDEKKGEYRIVDRRRFSSEGESIADDEEREEEERRSNRGAPQRVSQQAPQRGPQRGPRRDEEPPQHLVRPAANETAPPEQGQVPAGDDSVNFASFVVSLATQALMMLGEVPNPETRLTTVNLDVARETIEILGMLEEKTKGNLAEDEQRLFEEVLATVRMVYVKKVTEMRGSSPKR